ncbi:hypothetical protein HCN44_002340 [Aphidius gifuensis]|uniref:Eukaryotic translation initiation factor 3 subunit F n=1 Tax=Aphidius gifuensis TaxID=684658 RepID=A0A835CUZ7_APHGI|nr:hypothetical protein HCN44_002340 [Aphidius gifuensis]
MALDLIVKVHPVVLFQIVDAYERRNSDSHRVIGTLLGSTERGVVEVTNCFCVPHKEYDDQVEAELGYAGDLYEINSKVNPQENIVVIHEYYARECNNPVHLTVDTTLINTTRMAIKAYVCVQLGVPNGKQGSMFTPIKVQIISYEPEITGLQVCSKTQSAIGGVVKSAGIVEPQMDLAQIAGASTKLASMLDQVLAYVDDVIAGKQQPDNQVGRALLDMVNSVPKMTSEQFDDMFNSNVKDLLMVVALSQLIKTQLQLNEKLTLLTTL